jgi:hypothetical protein
MKIESVWGLGVLAFVTVTGCSGAVEDANDIDSEGPTGQVSSAILPVNPKATGLARIDFNGDGKGDLLWKGTGGGVEGKTAVWTMNGQSMLQSTELTSVLNGNWEISAVGDFNGDGKTDIVWRNLASGPNSDQETTIIWLMNGLTPTTNQLLVSPEWGVAATADLNGDGKSDLIWRNKLTGAAEAWLMNGLWPTIGYTLRTAGGNWFVSHVGDFNGDGANDLVWEDPVAGQTEIWLMSGGGTSWTTAPYASSGKTVTAIADLDNNGKSDLVWKHHLGQVDLWLMNGATAATEHNGALVNGTVSNGGFNWRLVRSADLNGDGKSDFLWQNWATGANNTWMMNGVGYTGGSTLHTSAEWNVIHAGDFNGDTVTDFIWRRSATGTKDLWLMNSTGSAPAAGSTIWPDLNWEVTSQGFVARLDRPRFEGWSFTVQKPVNSLGVLASSVTFTNHSGSTSRRGGIAIIRADGPTACTSDASCGKGAGSAYRYCAKAADEAVRRCFVSAGTNTTFNGVQLNASVGGTVSLGSSDPLSYGIKYYALGVLATGMSTRGCSVDQEDTTNCSRKVSAGTVAAACPFPSCQ